MSFNKSFATVLLSALVSTAYAQHHIEKSTATTSPLSFSPVLSQVLSDPELKDYKMESTVLTIAPGGADTVAHRHDCELFGYVLEGSVQIGLEKKEPDTFVAGQMFYERRNILHSLAANADKTKAARVLLIFIIKNGRVSYKPEYPRPNR